VAEAVELMADPATVVCAKSLTKRYGRVLETFLALYGEEDRS
jgi:hypothetical protein